MVLAYRLLKSKGDKVSLKQLVGRMTVECSSCMWSDWPDGPARVPREQENARPEPGLRGILTCHLEASSNSALPSGGTVGCNWFPSGNQQR